MACEPWPYDTACLPSGWPTELEAMTPAQRSAYDFAVDLLASLTLGVFGLCEVTARPCSLGCAVRGGYSQMGGGWFGPWLYGGRVYNGCGCASVASCGCGAAAASVRLDGPIASVVEVKVDGDVVPSTAYRVDGASLLVRTDGGTWPIRQDVNAPDNQEDTFSVRYLRGTAVPAGGRRAVSVLMVELDKARCGDSGCRLPSRVTNIVREGVTYSMLDDPTSLLDAGRTGIPEVDVWLSSVNPHQTRTRMRVYSPDLAARRVR